jgi:hypothetical protein
MDILGVVDGTLSMELWSIGIYLCKASSYLYILYQLRIG